MRLASPGKMILSALKGRVRLLQTAAVVILLSGMLPAAWAYNFTFFGGRLGRAGVDTGLTGSHDFMYSWAEPDNGTLSWYLDRNELPLAQCDAACFATLKARVQPELDKWALWIRESFTEAADLNSADIRYRFINITGGGADASPGGNTGTTLDWVLVRIDPDENDWTTAAGQDDFAYLILHESGHALGVGDLYLVNHGSQASPDVFEGEDFCDHGLPSGPPPAGAPGLPDTRTKADNVMEARGVTVLDNDTIHAAEWLWGVSGSDAIVTGELQVRTPGTNANKAAVHHGLTQTPATWTYRGSVAQFIGSPKVVLYFAGIEGARDIGPGTWTPTIYPDRVEFEHAGPYEGNFKFQIDCDEGPERYGNANAAGTQFTATPAGGGPQLFPFDKVFGADCTSNGIEIDIFEYTLAWVEMHSSLGTETVTLRGPSRVDVDLGSLGDVNSNGLEEVPTEMVQLDLTGYSTLVGGPVTVRVRPDTSAPYQRSTGWIEENVNNTPGTLDLPPFTTTGTAFSSFDIYFEIDVGGQLLHNEGAKPMDGEIREKPPGPGDTYEDDVIIPLYDEDGTPTDVGIWGAFHLPHPPPPDPHGTSFSTVDFGTGGTNAAIPADFFGPGSDPFEGQIALEGGFLNLFTLGDASNLFQRWGVPIWPEEPVGTNGTVDLEMIELDLVSTAPITVTYDGGLYPEDWDVTVGLSEKQPLVELGTLTATKTHANGGTFDTMLSVQPKLTFTRVGDGTVEVLDTGLEERPPLVFTSTDTPWVHELGPHLDILAPDDGAFVPMVEETAPGDPTSQVLTEMYASSPAPAQHVMRPATTAGVCVTLEMFAEFAECLDGPVAPTREECSAWDGNDSGHVDLGDFALVQQYICLPPPPPPGDNCDDPIVVTLPAELPFSHGDTTCGRLDDYTGTCLDPYDDGQDIIYELTVTDPIDVTITLWPHSGTSAGVAIDTACPPGDPCLASGIQDLLGTASIECLHLESGVYYVMNDNWPDPDDCYNFDLSIEPSVIPPNDDCLSAQPIGDVMNEPFDTTCATFDGLGFCMASPNVWYCYEATCTGAVTVSLCGSSYDTKLGVYHTCSCAGPMIDCNDNFCGLQSQITFAAPLGEMYLIEVGGASVEAGEGVLTIYCEPTPP